jgi:hypothetical protein
VEAVAGPSRRTTSLSAYLHDLRRGAERNVSSLSGGADACLIGRGSRRPDERSVSRFAEEPRIEEPLHGSEVVVELEIPQSLNLPRREAQSRSLEKLPSDVLNDRLKVDFGQHELLITSGIGPESERARATRDDASDAAPWARRPSAAALSPGYATQSKKRA